MKTIEYRTVDKRAWPRGPWDTEPDKLQWQDETTGLPCLIVRNRLGGLCGYVGVPMDHWALNRDESEIELSVHGGLTFGGPCQEGPEESSICHIPGSGEPDTLFWLGFDCGHAGDYLPAMNRAPVRCLWNPSQLEEYRDLTYVRDQVTSLALQLSRESP